MTPREFIWPVRVYWEDTDAGGIVYYANYLKFFERARTEWLRSLGLEQSALAAQSALSFVVAEVHLRYAAAARLDDALQLRLRLVEYGSASLRLQQQAWREQAADAAPLLLCSADVRVGCVHTASLRPARMPGTLRQLLAAWVQGGTANDASATA
ncbi:tol-pal system-associated acyl-CoA thioesterase [Thiomonas sp.]|jgi:acyl-CoA thioester hydrolase|uniref:tol-pal system-associated acyl-CoA thioesterase n=1 Tax=Thiomonas sp. TaxID=2047785 RepID=UPI002616D95B|nr:tol-pal system-associated acyl-CoA thioesterase [Thiomonas sp.]